jgi:predicted ATPase/DNA-binding CsgD family transcriptional regulator
MDHADLNSAIPLIEPLTTREEEVLRLMADDLTNQQMAERLVLSPTTVKWYTQQIYGKLGIRAPSRKRHQAVARARALGLLEIEKTPAGRPRYSLPVQTTPFVGRTPEINAIAGLLANPDVRLVTLLGPGGMGKTRLALEIGWRLVEPEAFGTPWVAFPDGVYFVPLQPVTTPDNMLWAAAEAVGFQFQSDGRAPQQQLLDFFREKRLLLIMDNFEHLLEGVDLVSAILQAAPGVQVLVTSRQTLNLHAETVYSLDGLPLPENVEDAPDYDAARLFVLGAQRACADFALQPDDLPALVRICSLVEGMPLAILLAAAWVEVLSVHEIAEEIARSFDFLTAEMRDAPRRQWSIRAVFEPTWQRLSEAERDVFKRLSVFRSGCSRQAAQAVTGASLPVLQALVNKAVLSRTPRGRYEIHELLRQYAEDRLVAAGEAETAHDAHCTYYAEFMHAREADLKGGDRQLTALNEIEADFENVRAAWLWAIAQQRPEDLKQMEWQLSRFLVARGRLVEGLELFQPALKVEENHSLIGRIMARCGFFCYQLGHRQQGEEWSLQSLAVARETGDDSLVAFALRELAGAAGDIHHDFVRAHQMVDESLALYQVLGDAAGVAVSLFYKGYIAAMQGDVLSALSYTQETLRQAQAIGDHCAAASALLNIGGLYIDLGEYQQALYNLEKSLAIFRASRGLRAIALVLDSIGVAAVMLGDYTTALERCEEALNLAQELGLLFLTASTLQDVASILSLHSRSDEADRRIAECRLVLQSVEVPRAQWGLPAVQAQMAYRRGAYPEALRLAQVALDYAQAHHLTVEEDISWVLLGLGEIKLGHLDTARRYLLTGFPRPMLKWHVTRAIYGLAALAAAEGQTERAVELAALAHHHQATEYEFKVYADELLAELQAVLPPDVYATAVERGAQLDPDAVVAAFLQEEDS